MFEQIKISLPLKGRTYSLYADELSTDLYYEKIKNLTNKFLKFFKDEREFLSLVQSLSVKKRVLKKIGKAEGFLFELINTLKGELSNYTNEVKNHLENLSLFERRDNVLSTSEGQYHLYMLEVELVNRIYSKEFKRSEYKIAFLPHCLRDLSRTCLSKQDEVDYFCKGCSKYCNINHASGILRSANVNPYIWRNAELKKLFGILKEKYQTVGVLGIACIPELIRGMRLCIKHHVPVIGIPLDANRCARWMGEFHDNTVNLAELKKLVS
ncbi:MAG: DUF116 domain-containing protein [Ignavibacteria bacterium]